MIRHKDCGGELVLRRQSPMIGTNLQVHAGTLVSGDWAEEDEGTPPKCYCKKCGTHFDPKFYPASMEGAKNNDPQGGM